MERNQNIGKWEATITNEDGKTPILKVNGTFPTNGQKPGYALEKANPQGINPSELLLTLIFGRLADPDGDVEFTVFYSEAVQTTDEYRTVLVMDDNGRKIANINIEASS